MFLHVSSSFFQSPRSLVANNGAYIEAPLKERHPRQRVFPMPFEWFHLPGTWQIRHVCPSPRWIALKATGLSVACAVATAFPRECALLLIWIAISRPTSAEMRARIRAKPSNDLEHPCIGFQICSELSRFVQLSLPMSRHPPGCWQQSEWNEVVRLKKHQIPSGWWFGTFFIFPYIGNNHPNWLIFFRGVAQPPTSHGFGA